MPGVEAAVTGETAGTHDFNEQMKSHAPLVFAFVLGALLPAAARHVPLDRDPDQGDPAQPALGRRGVRAARARLPAPLGGGLLGFHSNGAITSWLPLFMFVILFGLSMDYHVFILSRIKELVDGGMPTERGGRAGISAPPAR